ncbi:MAG TPA: MFS transporter [Pseudonocardiaceae bacterium]|jgi:sugar phosphate permease|nr:MFS transporter [Pseudonocardiaceae bacterium]
MDGEQGGRRRWLILFIGLAAQAATCSFLYGIPFLVPTIRAADHLSLAQAGVVVSAPTVGLLLTLIAWGAAADRWGERLVIAIGLGGAGILVGVAVLATGGGPGLVGFAVLLGAAGAFASSVNAASGRVVMGWFAADERGMAMGVRQTAQPLGVGIAAVALPMLAERFGYRVALLLPAALCVLCAILVLALVVDPPRPAREPGERAGSPYRSWTLWRVHGSSALLVVPQFTISAFALEYLVSVPHWSAGAAGIFLAVAQVLGAGGRLVTGYWSDRVGSRLRPTRQLAWASVAVMLLAALGNVTWTWVVAVAIVVGAVVTVADNGLGFTATAELAGSAWVGRALGVQNTTQNIAGALTPPLLGLVIGGANYTVAFALVAVFPLLAVAVVPVRAENHLGTAMKTVGAKAVPPVSARADDPRTR